MPAKAISDLVQTNVAADAEDAAAIIQGSHGVCSLGVERRWQMREPLEAGMGQTWHLGGVREEELCEKR